MEFVSLKDWLKKTIQSHVRKRCLHLRDAGNLIDKYVWAEIRSWAEEHRFFPYKVKGDVDFRLQYEQNRCAKGLPSSEAKGHKPLILDQSPKGIFCPDLYAQMSYAEVPISLHAYLVSATNDETWPKLVEAKPYRKILFDRLPQALEVYETFRARKGGFTDNALKMLTLATFLELPFLSDNLSPETLWQLGTQRQEQFRQAQRVFPTEVIESLKAKVKQAPKPFCDLLEDYPAAVRGILYLLILGQHLDKPAHYLASFDKNLFNYQDVESAVVEPLAQKIPPQSPLFQRGEGGIEGAGKQVNAEIEAIEKTLAFDKLDFLIDILGLNDFSRALEVLKNEAYSPLIASLALLSFLANTGKPQVPQTGTLKLQTVFTKLLKGFLEIAQLHQQAGELAKKLASFLRARKQKPWETIPLEDFITLYVNEGVCQLDYLLSKLERAKAIGEHVGLLSSLKSQTVKIWWGRIEDNLEKFIVRARKQLIEANRIYQQVFINRYPELLKSDEVKTTKDFVHRFLRKQIDLSGKKKVCILVFDGMRYDAWQLYVKPFFAQRYQMVCETSVFTLLPSETKISRKALFSGKLPALFSETAPENDLLQEALSEYDVPFEGKVDAKLSDRSGVTVAYTDERFSAVIFNFTDQIFHDQDWDMAYTYAQHVSAILEQVGGKMARWQDGK